MGELALAGLELMLGHLSIRGAQDQNCCQVSLAEVEDDNSGIPGARAKRRKIRALLRKVANHYFLQQVGREASEPIICRHI